MACRNECTGRGHDSDKKGDSCSEVPRPDQPADSIHGQAADNQPYFPEKEKRANTLQSCGAEEPERHLTKEPSGRISSGSPKQVYSLSEGNFPLEGGPEGGNMRRSRHRALLLGSAKADNNSWRSTAPSANRITRRAVSCDSKTKGSKVRKPDEPALGRTCCKSPLLGESHRVLRSRSASSKAGSTDRESSSGSPGAVKAQEPLHKASRKRQRDRTEEVEKARRCLWPVGKQDDSILEEAKKHHLEEVALKSVKWNFDFERETPLHGTWRWSPVTVTEAPDFYSRKLPEKPKTPRRQSPPADPPKRRRKEEPTGSDESTSGVRTRRTAAGGKVARH